MTTTAVVQIGNSDDKLSQERWHDFAHDVHELVQELGTVHFAAPSTGWKPWQNACFVLELDDRHVGELERRLGQLAAGYSQDSIALTLGETLFVPARS